MDISWRVCWSAPPAALPPCFLTYVLHLLAQATHETSRTALCESIVSGTGIDMALAFIAKHHGKDVAHDVAAYAEYNGDYSDSANDPWGRLIDTANE